MGLAPMRRRSQDGSPQRATVPIWPRRRTKNARTTPLKPPRIHFSSGGLFSLRITIRNTLLTSLVFVCFWHLYKHTSPRSLFPILVSETEAVYSKNSSPNSSVTSTEKSSLPSLSVTSSGKSSLPIPSTTSSEKSTLLKPSVKSSVKLSSPSSSVTSFIKSSLSASSVTQKREALPITYRRSSNRSFAFPSALKHRRSKTGDYGALLIPILYPDGSDKIRKIRDKNDELYERERTEYFEEMDQHYVSSSTIPDDEITYNPEECERIAWRSALFPVCNTFHEITVNAATDKYLGHGFYRDAWLIPDILVSGGFVLKQTRMPWGSDDQDHLPNAKSMQKIQREAIIMERLTASPRIVSTYGHCALSVLSENVPHEVSSLIVPNSGHGNQTEFDRLPQIRSLNNYTTMEKLDMALEMSRSIADLHGFPGVIVHGDIHPVQWLRSDDGTLKLNDFNNAEILDWSREKNSYCNVDRGFWGGMYRSPEEFLGAPIDEQADVYSMGNNIYTLLTGLWPFYEYNSYSVIQKKVLSLKRPYIDERFRNRNYVDGKLVEITERMWATNAKDRPTIFEVVDFLSEVKNVHTATIQQDKSKKGGKG